MSSRQQCNEFIETVLPSDLLDSAVDWIQEHMTPEQVFNEDTLVSWAHENEMRTLAETAARFSPDDVFEQHTLRDWAEQNGYVEQ